MNSRSRSAAAIAGTVSKRQSFKLAPLAQTMAMAIALAAASEPAPAQQAFSPAWFAQKGATQNLAASTGRLPNGQPASSLNLSERAQQAARQQTQRSVANLSRAAQAIAAQQAAQKAARAAALAAGSPVPDGLAEGGLKVDTNSLTAGWLHARDPVQTSEGGRTTVAIEQTADKAILNWETFNVGANTTVKFGQQANWSVLNRVNDPQARPSQIAGQIVAPGSVYILNRNGILFTGSSQVNVGNLVASAVHITDEKFSANFLTTAWDASGPTFEIEDATQLAGAVTVEAGAELTAASSGRVALFGGEVRNDGTLRADNGQVLLAAGQQIYLRASSDNGMRGLYVMLGEGGRAVNNGYLVAEHGNITLAGRDVGIGALAQGGRATAAVLSTSTNLIGNGSIILHALDAARATQVSEFDSSFAGWEATATGTVNISEGAVLSVLPDLGDTRVAASDALDRRSFIDVASGKVAVGGGALLLVPSGEIRMDARGSTGPTEIDTVGFADNSLIRIENGAILDVSGTRGVQKSVLDNFVRVELRGAELADSPAYYDALYGKKVWVDIRDTGRFEDPLLAGVEWVDGQPGTWQGSQLFNAVGYIGMIERGIGELTTTGGDIRLVSTGNIVLREGSLLNVSGGTIDYAAGNVPVSYVLDAVGNRVIAGRATNGLAYTGVAGQFGVTHRRWGVTETWASPVVGPQFVHESGYTDGAAAGTITLIAPKLAAEGDFLAVREASTRVLSASPVGGTLIVGDADAPGPTQVSPRLYGFDRITLQAGKSIVADEDYVGELLPDRYETVLSTDALNESGIGRIGIYANRHIRLAADANLDLGDLGSAGFHARNIEIEGRIHAAGGNILLETMHTTGQSDGAEHLLHLGGGAVLDVAGRWSNGFDGGRPGPVDGGRIVLTAEDRSAGAHFVANDVYAGEARVVIDSGAVLDVSGGARIGTDGRVKALGDAGSIAIVGRDVSIADGAELRGYAYATATRAGRGGSLLITDQHDTVIAARLDDALRAVSDGVLEAGVAAPMDLRLAEDLRVLAGTPLPVPAEYSSAVLAPGIEVAANASFWFQDNGYPPTQVVLKGNWVVPTGLQVYISTTGQWYYAGNTVPAGTGISRISGTLMAGTVLPASAFATSLVNANGAIRQLAPVGSTLDYDYTVLAGSTLGAGIVLSVDVAVVAPRLVSPEFFAKGGFASYSYTAGASLSVSEGTQVVLAPQHRVLPNVVSGIASGSGASAISMPATIDPALSGTASLDLAAGYYVYELDQYGVPQLSATLGRLDVGTGALLDVGIGGRIALNSVQSLYVDGTLHAPGGEITLNKGAAVYSQRNYVAGPYTGAAAADTLWIGSNARLLAPGVLAPSFNRHGLATGTVLDGGTVTLNVATAGYLVSEAGSVIDVSGGLAQVDLPVEGSVRTALSGKPVDGKPVRESTTVWSAGGRINILVNDGAWLDGDYRAAALDPRASGGTFALNFGEQLRAYYYGYGNDVGFQQDVGRRSVIIRQRAAATLPDGVGFGDVLPTRTSAYDTAAGRPWATGTVELSADRLAAAGFGTVDIESHSHIVFDGDVDLGAGRALILAAGVFAALDPAASSRVSLSAPYVRLGDSDDSIVDNRLTTYASQGYTTFTTPTAGAASLAVRAGQVLELGGRTVLQGFDGGRFISAGDLVFSGAPSLGTTAATVRSGSLSVAGNLVLGGTQLYPVSSSAFTARATAVPSSDEAGSPGTTGGTLTVLPGSGDAATLPLSIGGQITLQAPTIVQGGTLLAPLGKITLDAGSTGSVTLASGSLTDVSLQGRTLPYGTLINGTWYQGYGAEYDAVGNQDALRIVSTPSSKAIVINGDSVDIQAGSTLDLSGGGDVAGAEFTAGTGGSRNVLSGGGVYAVIPGAQPAFGAVASAESPAPAVGNRVYLDAVPGLPAGWYTLLPAEYALQPGAFRVERVAAQSDRVSGAGARLDGGYYVSGRLGSNFDGSQDARRSTFLVLSGDVARRYSEYRETTFSAAFAGTGAAIRPALPADAGQLSLIATHALTLEGRFAFGIAEGGRGGQADIAAQSIAVIADGAAPVEGYALSIGASALNAIGAQSLLLGGTREPVDTDADNVTDSVKLTGVSESILIANDEASALVAPEILLLTGNGQAAGGASSIRLADGAVIRAEGGYSGDAQPLAIGTISAADTRAGTGQGALLVLSNAANDLAVKRHDLGNAAGTLAGHIGIGSGVSLVAGGAILFDAVAGADIPADARITARSLELAATAIHFGDAPADAGGFIANAETLSRLSQAERLVLRSYGSIDLHDGTDLRSQTAALVLDAASLRQQGTGTARIEADQLVLRNTSGAQAAGAEPATNAGVLDLVAGRLMLGDGDSRILGFGEARLAARETHFDGIGTLTAGSTAAASDLLLTTPFISAAAGTDATVTATGAMRVGRGGQAALDDRDERVGSAGLLTFAGNTVDFGTDVRLPAGSLTLKAQQNLAVSGNARIDVSGRTETFFDQQRTLPAGDIKLVSQAGNVRVDAGSVLDLSDPDGGGELTVTVPVGNFTIEGEAVGAKFSLDAGSLPGFGAMQSVLNAGGFARSREIRLRSGDAVLDGVTRTRDFSLIVDEGGITVTGTIDASGKTGGSIELSAADDVILASGSKLTVAGEDFDGSGQGGSVFLSAGANRIVDGVDVTHHDAVVDIQAGSLIDLGVASAAAAAKVVTLDAIGSSITLPSGNTIGFPGGTPGSKISSTVAATITLADGSTRNLAANTPVELTAGSTLTLRGAGEVKVVEGVAGVAVALPTSGAFDTHGATTVASVPLTLNAPGSSVHLAGGTPVVLPNGTPGDNIITTTADSVSVTTVGNGTQVTVTAGQSALQLSAGSALTLLSSTGNWTLPVNRVTVSASGQTSVTLTKAGKSSIVGSTVFTFSNGLPKGGSVVFSNLVNQLQNIGLPVGGELAIKVSPTEVFSGSGGWRMAYYNSGSGALDLEMYFPSGTPAGVQMLGATNLSLVLADGTVRATETNVGFSVPAGATLKFSTNSYSSVAFAPGSIGAVDVVFRNAGSAAMTGMQVYGQSLTVAGATAGVAVQPYDSKTYSASLNASFLGAGSLDVLIGTTYGTTDFSVTDAVVTGAGANTKFTLLSAGSFTPVGDAVLSFGLDGGGKFDLTHAAIGKVSAGSVLTLAKDGDLSFARGGSGAIPLVLPASAQLAGLSGASVLDLGGGQAGTLHLRAPQTAAGTDLNVKPIAGNVLGAAHIIAEGYKVYDLSDSGGLIDDAVRTQVQADGNRFASNTAAIRNRLLASNPGLVNVLEVTPGAEVINANTSLPDTIAAILDPGAALGIPSGGSLSFTDGFSEGRLVVTSEGVRRQNTNYEITTIRDGLVVVMQAADTFVVPVGVPILLPEGSGTGTVLINGGGYAILPDGSRMTMEGNYYSTYTLPPGTVVYASGTGNANTPYMQISVAGVSVVLPAGGYEFNENIQIASLPAGSTFKASGAAIKILQSSERQVAVALPTSGTYRLNGVTIDALGVAVPATSSSHDQIAMRNSVVSGSWLNLSAGARVKVNWINANGSTSGTFRSSVIGVFNIYDAKGSFLRSVNRTTVNTNILVNTGEIVEIPAAGQLTLFTNGLAATVEIANNTVPADRLFGGTTALEHVVVTPLTDSVTLPTADLILARDWDLSDLRFGGGQTPGILTLRAAGNVIFKASLSDGFTGGAGILDSNLLLDDRSWSYRFVAGADFRGAGVLGVQPDFEVAQGKGEVILRAADAVSGTGNNGYGGRGVVVRTGTGSIDIAAAHDIVTGVLRTNGVPYSSSSVGSVLHYSAIYTAGRPANIQPGGGAFALLGDGRRAYGGGAFTLAYGGGDITLDAQRDVIGERKDSSSVGISPQKPENWLAAQGGYNATSGIYTQQVAWGPVFQNLREGVATLGGGNLAVTAGRDISGLNAATSDAGVYQGTTPGDRNLLTVGGGDLLLSAVRDVNGVNVYVASGKGTVDVGRNLGTAAYQSYHVQSWLQNSASQYNSNFAIGAAALDLNVRGNVDIGSIYNPFTLFKTYGGRSALNLTTLTGDIVLGGSSAYSGGAPNATTVNFGTFLPGNVELVAFNGDISLGNDGNGVYIAPAADGDLTVLASGSLTLGHLVLSDADPSVFATPGNNIQFAAALSELIPGFWPSFDRSLTHSASLYRAEDANPVRLYAVQGDVLGKAQNIAYNNLAGFVSLAKPAEIRAGRDVTNLQLVVQNFREDHATVVEAGRDVLFYTPRTPYLNKAPDGAGIWISGPGSLEITAGRDLDLGTSNGIQSVGNRLNPYLPEGVSANVVLTVGAGAKGPDYAGFAGAYLAPGSTSGRQSYVHDVTLANGESTTVIQGLVSFMRKQTGDETLGEAAAWEAFQMLPAGQRHAFIRSIYFAEIKRSGIEAVSSGNYNDGYLATTGLFPTDPALFPTDRPLTEAELKTFSERWSGYQALLRDYYGGDLSLRYSQVRSHYDGSIDILVPNGAIDGGLAQVGPDILQTGRYALNGYPASTIVYRDYLKQPGELGIVALRGGDVSIASHGDVIVNQSRIFAVGGGTLAIWSSEGDINAGKGAKTAVLAPPPRLVFDPASGSFELELTGAATGSGIATLITEPGQKPGDVYLFAPHGTVDAGDAGIRVSGNLIIAAQQIRGADNIEVKGLTFGLPQNTVNVAALTNASQAASSAATAAQDMIQRERSAARRALPSVFTVRVLGFGSEPAPVSQPSSAAPATVGMGYDRNSPVQVLGRGPLGDAQKASLTAEERRLLGR